MPCGESKLASRAGPSTNPAVPPPYTSRTSPLPGSTATTRWWPESATYSVSPSGVTNTLPGYDSTVSGRPSASKSNEIGVGSRRPLAVNSPTSPATKGCTMSYTPSPAWLPTTFPAGSISTVVGQAVAPQVRHTSGYQHVVNQRLPAGFLLVRPVPVGRNQLQVSFLHCHHHHLSVLIHVSLAVASALTL